MLSLFQISGGSRISGGGANPNGANLLLGQISPKTARKQECIPVGCVPSAAVAVCWGVSASVHAGKHTPPARPPNLPPPDVGLETAEPDRLRTVMKKLDPEGKEVLPKIYYVQPPLRTTYIYLPDVFL